jgi:hypothetical protein
MREAENQDETFVPAWFLDEVRLFTVCCSESKTPRLVSTMYSTATATNKTMKATTETTKLNFMTDHGSTRDSVSWAWRREFLRLPLLGVTLARGRQEDAVAAAGDPVATVGRLPE